MFLNTFIIQNNQNVILYNIKYANIILRNTFVIHKVHIVLGYRYMFYNMLIQVQLDTQSKTY